MNSFSNLSISNSLFNVTGIKDSGSSISNDFHELDISLVIRDNSGHLGEMPRVPLLDSHGKCIDVLIEKFKQTD